MVKALIWDGLDDASLGLVNYNPFSTVPCKPDDVIPPAAVTDLAASSPTANSITLAWTAPGDDEDEFTDLYANYPNPFNPDTWIPYYLSQDADVTIRIYNSAGQLVRTLGLGQQVTGIYMDKDKAAYWNGKDDLGQQVASGVYYYTLRAGDFSATRKMILVK